MAMEPEASETVAAGTKSKGDAAGKGKGKGKGALPPPPGCDPAAPGLAKGGKKGGPPPGGGKSGAKGAATFSKPEIKPSEPMKPLWWKRLLFGSELKPGASIWEKVTDDTSLLPAQALEARFSKTSKAAKPKAQACDGSASKQRAEEALLRVGARESALQERELKRLPPAEEVGQALDELDEKLLALDELERVREHACPQPAELQLLLEERLARPGVPLALREQYWAAIGRVPAYRERIDCWLFVRTIRDKCAVQTDALQKLMDMWTSFQKSSSALSSLLGLLLVIGNHLNKGTEEGDAVAFGVEVLDQLGTVLSADGKDLRHFIMEVYLGAKCDVASELLDGLSPLFLNVRRRLVKDSDDTLAMSKAVQLTVEEADQHTDALKAEFEERHETMLSCVKPLEESHAVRLQLLREFALVDQMIQDVAKLRDSVKQQFADIIGSLCSTGMRSGDFCLLWDDFFMPGDVVAARLADSSASGFDGAFLQGEGEAPGLAGLQTLWQLSSTSRHLLGDDEDAFGQRRSPLRRQLSPSPASGDGEVPAWSPDAHSASENEATDGIDNIVLDNGNDEGGEEGSRNDLQLIPLPWRKVAQSPSCGSLWQAAKDAKIPLGKRSLEKRFSVAAVAAARALAESSEAATRGLLCQQESAARWSKLAQQLPRAEDVLRCLEAPPSSAGSDEQAACTAEQLDQVREMLQVRAEAQASGEAQASVPAEDAYLATLSRAPSHADRLNCVIFVMTYRQRLASASEALQDFLDVAESFRHSEVLPSLLGLMLATGNYLNGGSNRGRADGFDLGELDKFQGVADPEGKDLRHFILQVFLSKMPEQAERLLCELRPCFLNVRRTIGKDTLGTSKLSKTVRNVFEEIDEEVSSLMEQLVKTKASWAALGSAAGADNFAEGVSCELREAQTLMDDLLTVREEVKDSYTSLLQYLQMKQIRSSDFCLLWDDFFLPADFMVNKGKDQIFVPAFCCGEPFRLEHLQVLWGLEEASTVAEDSEDEISEGPLDAEEFCRALLPLVRSPEDFTDVARSYSACPGTGPQGGDLGEVERGQMHPNVEAALFDPELVIGSPLGPVETDAGFHLLLARKKSRGILSTTVAASHILVTRGRYRPPACEVAVTLTPNLAGDELDMTRTWRRRSFALSLPPAMSHLLEELEEVEALQVRRQTLRGDSDLRLLFRWEGAFIFSVKGILTDIGRDFVGPIHLVDGMADDRNEPKVLGELLTSEDARRLHPGKEGFEARLQWLETAWQDAEGLLDADSICTVQILLRRCDEPSGARTIMRRGSGVRLRLRPTRLAYAASTPGLRLALCSAASVQDRCATLLEMLESGEVRVKVDNNKEEIIDPRPGTVVRASALQRAEGSRLLVLGSDGVLADAEVLAHMGRHHGNRHRLRLLGAHPTDMKDVEMDLNEMNHSVQRFSSVADFESARVAYCRQLVEDGRYIEDAITGNRVDISEQLVRVRMEERQLEPDADSLRRMPFDDIEWVSDSSFRLGDRVWAQGREGFVEQLQKQGRYVVKFSDGASSPALQAASLKRARPIAGVQNPEFAEVENISDLAQVLLLGASQNPEGRLKGAHSAQPVLVRAGPGTGKTWSMQQLLFLLAEELGRTLSDSDGIQLRLVPLLIPIQKLARMLRQQSAQEASNLVLFYIENEFSEGDTRNMLEQAFEMRSLVVMLDGIDEAASMKLAVEEFVTKTLVPMGVPLLVTSRPEGIRKRFYSRDFVILNLQPLSCQQQHNIIEKQLQENPFFEHLMALSSARREPSGMQAVQEHVDFLKRFLEHDEPSGDFEAMLEARMRVFDEVCSVPVLLSVMACAFAVKVHRLPRDLFELYEMGMLSTLRRRMECREEDVQTAFEMLQRIAVANHLAKRRTFQAEDLREALKGKPQLLAAWSRLLEEGSVPLVKILTLGDTTGEFQFSHLSFQEALFIRALASAEPVPSGSPSVQARPRSRLMKMFCGSDSSLSCSLNDAFYRNTMLIGRGHIGEALARWRPAWSLDCQPRLSELGRLGLRHLLVGARSLRVLDAANVKLGDPAEVVALVDGLSVEGLPCLEFLSLARCELAAESARNLGLLFKRCPSLKHLDLEGNRQLMSSAAAVETLSETIGEGGLPKLQRLGLRWCHMPPSATPAMKALLVRCCPCLTEVDIQGNRGLTRSLLGPLAASLTLKGSSR